MNLMTCTPAEERDALRAVLALIRAGHNDDTAGAAAILDGATCRELYSIAAAFTATYATILARWVIACLLIEDDAEREFARTATIEQIRTDPGLHAHIEDAIARLQAALLAEDAIMGGG